MSAYICNRNHIVYLVQSAVAISGHEGFRWYYNGNWKELKWGEDDASADAANMLWRENIKSVSARYPGQSSAALPGPSGEDFVIQRSDFARDYPFHPDLAQVFKACDCYSYQSCEHDTWEQSEAFAFIQSLRSEAWCALPGYEDAAWGAPERESQAA